MLDFFRETPKLQQKNADLFKGRAFNAFFSET